MMRDARKRLPRKYRVVIPGNRGIYDLYTPKIPRLKIRENSRNSRQKFSQPPKFPKSQKFKAGYSKRMRGFR